MILTPTFRRACLTLAILSLGWSQAYAQSMDLDPDDNNTFDSISDLPPGMEAAPVGSGGWDGLARVLEALKPGVDTSLPPTAAEIAAEIEKEIDQGKAEEALIRIQGELNAIPSNALGTNVQLLFLQARAYAALGRETDALAAYRDMTQRFPELPEPWNNLAALYTKQGRLEDARQALAIALQLNPDYALAHYNMGQILQALALQSYDKASRMGLHQARTDAARLRSLK